MITDSAYREGSERVEMRIEVQEYDGPGKRASYTNYPQGPLRTGPGAGVG